MTARILVIAYGNPLRGDDGLAWRVADELERRISSPEIEIQRLHQLTPELAEKITHFKAAIFIDAASPDGDHARPGEIRIEQIRSSDAGLPPSRLSHHLTPPVILAMAKQLYAATVPAFSATLAGQSFEHEQSLSPAVEAAMPAFVAQTESLVQTLHGN